MKAQIYSHLLNLLQICLLASLVVACAPSQVTRLEPGRIPSEFVTKSRSNLELPPGLELPEPTKPQLGEQSNGARQPAQAAIFGKTSQAFIDQDLTDGERSLLVQLGADQANPEIERILREEATQLRVLDQGIIGKLLDIEPDEVGVVVHPGKETQRIATSESLGEPLSGTESPYLLVRERGWLEP